MLPGIPPDPPVLVPAIAPPTPPTPIVFLYFCCYEDVGVIEPIKMAANCGESEDL